MSAENEQPMRTVLPTQGMIPVPEMNIFAYAMAVILIPILLPLLPLVIAVLVYGWLKRQLAQPAE